MKIAIIILSTILYFYNLGYDVPCAGFLLFWLGLFLVIYPFLYTHNDEDEDEDDGEIEIGVSFIWLLCYFISFCIFSYALDNFKNQVKRQDRISAEAFLAKGYKHSEFILVGESISDKEDFGITRPKHKSKRKEERVVPPDLSDSKTKAISDMLSNYDQTLTENQRNATRYTVNALNSELNPCDENAVFFKVDGREVIIANTAQDTAILKSFCDNANVVVGGGL